MIDISQVDIGTLPFLPVAERDSLPDCPAIYFAIDEAGEVLYIGRANSLSERWRKHHRTNQLEGASVAWLTVSDVQLLPEIERAMIKHFRPSLNNSRRHYAEGDSHHIYLLIPPMLYEWAEKQTRVRGFRNIQAFILDLLRKELLES